MIRTIASLTHAPDFPPKSMFQGQLREAKQSPKTILVPTTSSPHDTELPLKTNANHKFRFPTHTLPSATPNHLLESQQ